MSPKEEVQEDRRQEGEEGGSHPVCQGCHQEEAEEEEEEERSLYPGKHLHNLLKNSWETHQQFLQETGPRWTPSSPNGSCTAA